MSKTNTTRKQIKGLGSVYFDKTHNYWVGCIELGSDERGKRKRKKFTGDTQASVIKRMKEFQMSPESAIKSATANMSFSRFGLSYIMNYKKPHLKGTSFTVEYRIFVNNVEPYIGHILLGNITPDIIQIRLINALIAKGYSLSTIHKAYVTTNEIMRHAQRANLIASNPCEFVPPPNKRTASIVKPPREPRVLNDAEIERFKEAALSPRRRNGKYVLSIIYTGLRCGEASALKWSDIDFENNIIKVQRNLESIYEGLGSDNQRRVSIEQKSTKTKEYRRVFMTKSAKKYLQEIYDERHPKPDDYVTLYQKPPSPDVLRFAYIHLAKAAKIPNPQGIHTLRHTCASLLIRNGVDIKIVSEMLGHSSVSFTYDTYVHIIEEHSKAVLEAIDV